jgi:hypothetical protein
MLYAVNAYLHTYGDGGGWREICSGEAYLGRFSGHRPTSISALISSCTVINRQWNLKDLHCLENALRFLIVYSFTLCREMKTVANVLYYENL